MNTPPLDRLFGKQGPAVGDTGPATALNTQALVSARRDA